MKLIQAIFPPPRYRVGWGEAWPLVAFLALYAGICGYLVLAPNGMIFGVPLAFFWMLVSPWAWWLHVAGGSGLARWRGRVALWVRLALIGLFVMLLAEPRAKRTSDILSVMYTVDISDSVGVQVGDQNMRDEALEFVARMVTDMNSKENRKVTGRDKAGVVVFGRNAAVELPPRENVPLEGDRIVLNSLIKRDATNLEQSLSLAAAMLPEEDRGRIVLISDGTETVGDLSQLLDDLKSREIAVDVLPIRYNYKHEVWIEQLELPRNVKIGENYEAAVVLSSLNAGTGRLLLKEDGRIIAERELSFPAGKSRYTFPVYLRTAGFYQYEATIEVDRGDGDARDNWDENNTVLNYLYVEGEGKVLIVNDPNGNPADWESLVKAITESERSVVVKSAYEFSGDPLAMMPYDCVIFVNVGVDAFDVIQLEALKDAVENQGMGFLMVGGPNSFGPGGYRKTVVEEILPVEMDITKKKVLPKGALAIILHTCEFPEGNTWGKRITKQAVKVLHPQDEVGVLVYGGMGEQWLWTAEKKVKDKSFHLLPARDFSEIAKHINGATIGDMPSFSRTMEMAIDDLSRSDASAKHVIIISDGDAAAPPPALLEKFVENKVTISTIAIFPHGGTEVGTLRMIAEVCGGRFYFPDDPNLLPSIFIKESNTLKRTMIQNETVQPEMGFPSPIMAGISVPPPLHGYVLTTAKRRAETVLQTPPKETSDGAGEIDPLLATWKSGLGTTAAFTGDLSPNWGRDWVEWDQYRAFLQQLLIRISRVRQQGNLRLWTYSTGSHGTVVVEDFKRGGSPLNLRAVVKKDLDDKIETLTLRQVGPHRYQARFPLWGKGRYQIRAKGVRTNKADDDETVEGTQGGLIVSYSPEYLKFSSNRGVLQEIADKTGGKILDLEETTVQDIHDRRQPKTHSRPIFDWFLVGLACLVPLDVAIRRVQLDPSVLFGWIRGGRRQPSTATMGALLARKQTVEVRLEKGPAQAPRPIAGSSPSSTPTTSRRPTRQPGPASPPASPGDTIDSQSTTERLLALKRKRQQDDDPNRTDHS